MDIIGINKNGEYGVLLNYIPLTDNYKILTPETKIYDLLLGKPEYINEKKYFIRIGEDLIRFDKRAIKKVKNFLQRNKNTWPRENYRSLEIMKIGIVDKYNLGWNSSFSSVKYGKIGLLLNYPPMDIDSEFIDGSEKIINLETGEEISGKGKFYVQCYNPGSIKYLISSFSKSKEKNLESIGIINEYCKENNIYDKIYRKTIWAEK